VIAYLITRKVTNKAKQKKKQFLGTSTSNQDQDQMASELTLKCAAIQTSSVPLHDTPLPLQRGSFQKNSVMFLTNLTPQAIKRAI
jgi:hypothetical protein